MRDRLTKRLKRKIRTRKRINSPGEPRLSVFRSSKHIYAQIIDDKLGKTLVTASDFELGEKDKSKKITKTGKAKLVGEILAKKAFKKNILEVVFDRGWFKYHGRVKALAEGARSSGLKF